MIDKPNGVALWTGQAAELNDILILQTPIAEEIARAIWQRQHAALPVESVFYHTQWRDQSVPTRFWNEFLLDAQAVLSLLHERHHDYQNAREVGTVENRTPPSSVADPPARHCARDGAPSEADFAAVMVE